VEEMSAFDPSLLTRDAWEPEPFPHAVIDGLWNPFDLNLILLEFPGPSNARWATYADPEERGKKAIDDPRHWGRNTRSFFHVTASAEFRAALRDMTGIEDLSSDEVGGGLHETGEGGLLGMHRDFNYNPNTGAPRRLNLLTYLNDGWDCSWGGCLYLGADQEKVVVPAFNRTVLFECGPESWHGHPDPIVGDHLRRSLATYYYTPPGSVDLGEGHSTVYRRYQT